MSYLDQLEREQEARKERQRKEAEAFQEAAFDNEPLGDLTCGRCFGIHADRQCPNDS